MKRAFGFTLVELLIVISIIGILVAFMATNLSGARQRARDAKAKSELAQLKNALTLYSNVYGDFPATSGAGTQFAACGPNGNAQCPGSCSTASFAAGGADGCQYNFMQYYTKNSSGTGPFFKYYKCPGSGDYRIKATLENLSDKEIAESQLRCPASSCLGATLSFSAADYVVCP